MNKRTFLYLYIAVAAGISSRADAPAGYYSSCEGKSDRALLRQLENVISDHTVVGYKSLYDVYVTSDVHPDGTIWDMYSTKNWGKSFDAVKCGNYSVVGDCINKEHSFPKSWFDDASPMYSDAFHIYPTDGKVNGQRSNFPYGECSGGTTLPASGNVRPLGKLGRSTFPGYSGTVFEPDDEYKGDLARSYFYMAACYNSRISTWESDMLSRDSYPCFSSWAIDLLLKWHRQDPVSEKETVRNDAVYAHQHNRNPFIDHPELAEYIWGDKTGQPWSAADTEKPRFLTPVNNSTIDFGTAATGHPLTVMTLVSGVKLPGNVSVSVSGGAFSAGAVSLPEQQVNAAGANLPVTFDAVTAGDFSGTLTLACGDLSVKVTLRGTAVDGLPALAATEVSEDGFTANWVCIDGASAEYTLDVRRGNISVEGYPRTVPGAPGHYRVSGLEPETAYTYTVSNGTLTSAPVSVTTPAPLPSVTFLFDGELAFTARPGQPSEAAELLAVIDNIPGDVLLSVSAPFELSLNKQEWGRQATLAPGADRFYLRLGATTAGSYTTSLVAEAEGFRYDDVEVEGVVSDGSSSFLEDFEPAVTGGNGYGELTYQGSASTWYTNGVYFEKNGSNSQAYNSTQAARFNKNGTRVIYMLQDKPGGAGTISFQGKVWSKESNDCLFTVSVSSDGGATWEPAGDVTVRVDKDADGNNRYNPCTVTANRSGNIRVRLEQKSGGRCMVDDLAVSDYSASLLTPDGNDYHSWDAYCVGHALVIENSDSANSFAVYSIDGRLVFAGTVPTGQTFVSLPAGLYVVTVADFSRRVLLR